MRYPAIDRKVMGYYLIVANKRIQDGFEADKPDRPAEIEAFIAAESDQQNLARTLLKRLESEPHYGPFPKRKRRCCA